MIVSTYTVLHRPNDKPFALPLIGPVLECFDYDHAEREFEAQHPDQTILGIYEGDITREAALDRYHRENGATLQAGDTDQ